MRITRVDLETARLVTIDEHASNLEQYAGAFVRIRPTASATDAAIKGLKKALLEAGAVAVRTMPRPPGDALQLSGPAELMEQIMNETDTAPPVREMLAKLVEQSTSKHKERLGELLTRLADEEGL